ncbi:MAG: exosortase H [Acidobacteriota bacterium]|nr:exosortase H [Acidobacteriota bacterium]
MKSRTVFVAKFAAAMVVLYVVVALNPVNDYVIVPFTVIVARSAAVMLRVLGSGVESAGTVMRSPRFALDVQNGCNGIEAAILLAAAIFAFPATLRSRLIGLSLAVVAIELINVVRLSSLFWLGDHYRRVFDFFHVAVWQSLVILAAISIFILWSWKFAEKPLAESR